MARAMSKSSHRPEPLFFLQEVMEGFFKQGVLLDNLIEDASFSGKNIEFHINIQDNEVKYTWSGEDKTKPEDGSESFGFHTTDAKQDVIVGIPGGKVGTHALYSFLENILRNSTKYGKRGSQEDKLLVIHLNLEKCKGKRSTEDKEPAWILSIWDNISTDTNHSVSTKIRGFIKQNLINDDGSMNIEGHGIQEMKLCAELLSGDLRFSADDGYEIEGDSFKCNPCTNGPCAATEAYKKSHVYHTENNDDKCPVQKPQALRCYVDDKYRLVYDLLLPIPVLLGVVRLGEKGKESPDGLPSHIKYYNSLEKLAKKGAHIAILLDNCNADIEQTLKKVAALHSYLPFRLMLVTKRSGDWGDKPEEKIQDGMFESMTRIPNNRLRVCKNEDDLQALLSNGPNNNTKFVGAEGWDAVMLRAYDAWLRVYKPEAAKQGKKWHLCLGFQRKKAAVDTSWGNDSGQDKKNVFKADGESYIRMDVGTYLEDGNTEQIKLIDCSTALVFNNHGQVFKLDGESCFKQDFGSKESLSLYQSLESPPQEAFGFAFFVYSLVEAALTNVAVLDERVAHTLLAKDDHWDFKDDIFLSVSVKAMGCELLMFFH